jgi:hypothetical protein
LPANGARCATLFALVPVPQSQLREITHCGPTDE